MKTKIQITDFTFKFTGRGHYKVTYQSPVTLKEYTAIVTDMTLIDATKNDDNPTIKSLNELKWFCKNK